MPGPRCRTSKVRASTDADRGLILVAGAVPGAKGGYVLVSDARKRPAPDGLPFPGAVKAAPDEETPEEAAPEAEGNGDED